MNRQSAPPDSGDLLNLPLSGPVHGDVETVMAQEALPLGQTPDPDGQPGGEPQSVSARALVGMRLRAAAADAVAVLAAIGVAAFGSWLLGVDPNLGALPGLVVFALCFSFLYHVVPLAFWGRSPGMALAAIIARDADDAPLTLRQALARWFGALLTVVGLGLPLLLLLSGRSLADRLSGSRVRPQSTGP